MTQPPFGSAPDPQMPPQAYAPPQVSEPQQPYPPAPVQPMAPPPKKSKAGLTVVIILVVLALVGVGGYFGFRAVFANRLTPYCQTYIQVGKEMPAIESQLANVNYENLSEVSDAYGALLGKMQELRDASPPDTVIPSLDITVNYLTEAKGYADANDFEGLVAFLTTNATAEFQTAAQKVDDATVAYCNG